MLIWVPDSKAKTINAIPLLETFSLIVKNKTIWRVLLTDLMYSMGTSVSGALYIFFAATYFELPEHASIALLFYFLASFLAMPMWMKLAYKVGKDNALKIALIYAVSLNLIVIPLGAGQCNRFMAFYDHVWRCIWRCSNTATLDDC